MERIARIELATSVWKTEVLPINYIRMAVYTGFEPVISRVTGEDVNRYTNRPMVVHTGFEPVAPAVKGQCLRPLD